MTMLCCAARSDFTQIVVCETSTQILPLLLLQFGNKELLEQHCLQFLYKKLAKRRGGGGREEKTKNKTRRQTSTVGVKSLNRLIPPAGSRKTRTQHSMRPLHLRRRIQNFLLLDYKSHRVSIHTATGGKNASMRSSHESFCTHHVRAGNIDWRSGKHIRLVLAVKIKKLFVLVQ